MARPADRRLNPTLDRRQFIARALAEGMSLSAAALAFAACSRNPSGPAEQERAAAPLGKIEDELRIYNWSDYVAEDTIPSFEKEFGVKVVYDTYESNEEMLARLQSGASGYDIVVPTRYIVTVLAKSGMLRPLDRSLLTNLGNVEPMFLETPLDSGDMYGVPWQWGITGIAYRADKLEVPPDSWATFFDARFKRKMTLMDDARDVIGSFLRYRGRSINSVDAKELEAAKADSIAAARNVRAFISAPVKAQLIAGDVWVAQLWDGDTLQAKAANPNLDFALPKEGSTLWVDSLVVPRDAPHPRAAHEFMNFVLRPDVGAKISEFTGYGTPNRAAQAKIEHPIAFPTAAQLAILEYQQDLGRDTLLWDRIWTEIKAAS